MSKGSIKNRFRYLVGDQNRWLKRVNLHEQAYSSPSQALSLDGDNPENTYLFVYKRGRLVGSLELRPFLKEWETGLLNRHPKLVGVGLGHYALRSIMWIMFDLPPTIAIVEKRKLNEAMLKAALEHS
jgi:hypothetical protein